MPGLVEQRCKECGKWFVYERTGRGRLRHTCSPECKSTYLARQAREKRTSGEWAKSERKPVRLHCVECNTPFISTNYRRKTCGGKCSRIACNRLRIVNARPCEGCNLEFKPRENNIRFCSTACLKRTKAIRRGDRFIARWRRNLAKVFVPVLNTAIDFTKTARPIQSCDSCGKVWLRRKSQERPLCRPCKVANARASRKATKHKRRMQMISHGYEVFDPIEIHERDMWKCQLCGCKVKQLAEYAPHQATLDHIVPLAKGGGHTRLNVQTACHTCNSAKADRMLGQMRLVG